MQNKYPTLFIALIIWATLIVASPLLAQENSDAFVITGEINGAFDQAPQEVQLALKALIAALRGKIQPDQFDPVLFPGDVLLKVRKAEGTFYSSFDVDSIQISYINHQSDDSLQLIGLIRWEDPNQRRAGTAFSITYKTNPNFIMIKDAVVTRMPPNMPRVLVFLVPENAVKKQLKIAKDGYLPLLKLISEKSVRLNDSAPLPKGKQNYMLFAFSLDRLARGERIDYIIGDGDAKTDIRPKEQKLINYSGWQVLVLATTFDLKEKKPPLYRVFYTPNKNHPTLESKPQQAAAFTL
ncbi:MAG: hypothetical protein KAG92_04870, partial [Deltaproteobacteria bacterium]|nr:hypothetical protein [Deltaproteobacteria bacterium]